VDQFQQDLVPIGYEVVTYEKMELASK
jgi:hypothetical protein